jgi:hypothetical protein
LADIPARLITIPGHLTISDILSHMYDHPNITLSNTPLPRQWNVWGRYRHEGSNDAQMQAAIKQSPLSALNPEDAELYIAPIPMAKILTSKHPYMLHLAFDTLVNHELFRQHQGNKHILISTPLFVLYRNERRGDVPSMKNWYPLIYNVTPVLSWDPNAVYNAVKEGVDFTDYNSLFQKIQPLSRHSFSVGLGDAVSSEYTLPCDSIELQLASLEKFQNSSNLGQNPPILIRPFSATPLLRISPMLSFLRVVLVLALRTRMNGSVNIRIQNSAW